MREQHSDRDIKIINSDANEFLSGDQLMMSGNMRGVLFLDPFATEVKWSTIEKIAKFEALDTWILFPFSALNRMLPRDRKPEAVNLKWAEKLNIVFGDDSWRNMYPEKQDMFGISYIEKERFQKLLDLYKDRLAGLFGKRFLPESRTLKNTKNAPLFEFIFCAGNLRGAKIAKSIAEHLLNKMSL